MSGAQRALPVLHGDRVILRIPRADEATKVLAFFAENQAHLAPTDPPRPARFYTESFWIERLTACAVDFQRDAACHLFVFRREQPDEPAGYLNLSNIVRGAFQACHLGYGLGASFEGRGLMSESVRLAIHLAFGDLRLHRIMANYLPSNERSARLLDRLGFQREGYATRYLLIDGEWRDHVLTALTNDRWEAPPPDVPR